MRMTAMLLVSFRDRNCRFWSHLQGIQGRRTIFFPLRYRSGALRKEYRMIKKETLVLCWSVVSVRVAQSLSHS